MSIFKSIKNQFKKSETGKTTDRRSVIYICSKLLVGLVIALILIGLSYIILYPLIYCVSFAIRDPMDVYDSTIILIPKHFTINNFFEAWEFMGYGTAFVNTFNTAVWPTILQVVVCSMAGYGLSRFKFPGKGLLFALLVFTMIVPPQTVNITMYVSFRYFDPLAMFTGLNSIGIMAEPYVDLTSTLWAVILPALFAAGIRSGLFVFIYRQFFSGFPKELEEAACIDGCGAIGTFIRILVPNAGPAFTTVFLFCLVWYWNDFYTIPLFMPELDTLPFVMDNMRSQLTASDSPYAGMNKNELFPIWRAGLVLYIAPLFLLFVTLQKKFTESITRAGIVG